MQAVLGDEITAADQHEVFAGGVFEHHFVALNNDHVAGFVLNPFTDNLRFNSDMVASLLKQRNAMLEKIKQTAAQTRIIAFAACHEDIFEENLPPIFCEPVMPMP